MTARQFEGQRVLVAGSSGFLGRHLVRRLSELGADVLAVSRKAGGADERVRYHQADFTDLDTARQIFKEATPQIVYQLCGHADGGRSLELVLPTFESDIQTTVHLLLAAVEHPVRRFILTASLEEPTAGEPASSPYAAAKMASTAYARMFHLLYKVPVVILRPYMTYGPGQSEKKVISYIIQSLLKGQPPILNSGNRMVDWVYIADVIDGFIAAATVKDVEGGTFDLGTGQIASIQDVCNKLVDLINSNLAPVFRKDGDRPFERERIADTDPARTKLGWEPKVSLDEGLRLTIDWWSKQTHSGK